MRYVLYKDDRERTIKAITAYLQSLDDNTYQVVIKDYDDSRSANQNRLQRKWLLELAEQGDMTSEQYRAHSKLHIGVPILRNESTEFKESYDRLIRPRPYPEKLELMSVPLDFPVSRLMTVSQAQRYLTEMFNYWTGKGFILTQPGEQ